jgi:RNA polymerase-binding transcription factor DksA
MLPVVNIQQLASLLAEVAITPPQQQQPAPPSTSITSLPLPPPPPPPTQPPPSARFVGARPNRGHNSSRHPSTLVRPTQNANQGRFWMNGRAPCKYNQDGRPIYAPLKDNGGKITCLGDYVCPGCHQKGDHTFNWCPLMAARQAKTLGHSFYKKQQQRQRAVGDSNRSNSSIVSNGNNSSTDANSLDTSPSSSINSNNLGGSESCSSSVATARKPARPGKNYCVLCKSNKEPRRFYLTHKIRDDAGNVTCPILKEYTCTRCYQKGDHTHSYCPLSMTTSRRVESVGHSLYKKPMGVAAANKSHNDRHNRSQRIRSRRFEQDTAGVQHGQQDYGTQRGSQQDYGLWTVEQLDWLARAHYESMYTV